MPIKTVFLDIGHMGKPGKPLDRGASFEGDFESALCMTYALFAEGMFLRAGYEVFLLCYGEYATRKQSANRITANNPRTALYLSCHLNAGSGNYSLVEHYYDATEQTRRIADIVVSHFRQKLGTKYPSMSFAAGGVKELSKGERGAVCLKETNMSALILEPLFIDNPEHLLLARGHSFEIARAIFDAVEEFNCLDS